MAYRDRYAYGESCREFYKRTNKENNERLDYIIHLVDEMKVDGDRQPNIARQNRLRLLAVEELLNVVRNSQK